MIAIIDYDAGNLKSVEKALQYLGEDVKITSDANEILGADKIILPGVGAFGDAMEKLNTRGLSEVIREAVKRKIPLLGICLGLQLLFEASEESPGVDGLSVLKGKIVRIPDKEGFKVPHIGWNSLKINPESKLFSGIPEDSYVYFVHSYYLAAEEPIVAATTDYVVDIHAAVEKEHVFACQFHPEKSGDIGLKLLKNFATM
ncbi:MAG: imidazole glycerol phosphate synthase subunit HisH [Lachnospiraceae bacterium]|nr:imidazole glycerol phosphate synthase subunit HisH [Lachnospiraceae bacterium]MBR6643779.1 imidazole glycerol phosphate synthase subunit HisH [Lachnospiraceae bacterium]